MQKKRGETNPKWDSRMKRDLFRSGQKKGEIVFLAWNKTIFKNWEGMFIELLFFCHWQHEKRPVNIFGCCFGSFLSLASS